MLIFRIKEMPREKKEREGMLKKQLVIVKRYRSKLICM
jgi:hypothetical protein